MSEPVPRCPTCRQPRPATETRRCKKCGEEKPLVEFHRLKLRPNLLDSYCKPCRRAYMRVYFQTYRR